MKKIQLLYTQLFLVINYYKPLGYQYRKEITNNILKYITISRLPT